MKISRSAIVPSKIASAAAFAVLQIGVAWAQNAPADTSDALKLDEVVVTATPEARSKMKQSLSVSSIDGDAIQDAMPASSAEILRNIPGIRSESSSGEGNANVTVRGLPISAGGSRYVQFQEDGLPVLLNGDFNFLTPDVYLRADYGTDGVEVVRGGSASTLASNAPGGVINFISKTGEQEGGSIGITTNVGGSTDRRADFNLGQHMSDKTTFNLSGFMRDGQGPRATDGVNMEGGGQIKMVLASDLGGGNNFKLIAKFLDDKTPLIMDTPVNIQNGSIQTLNGVDPRTFSPYSNNLPTISSWGPYGGSGPQMNDGLHATQKALGGEVNLNLGGGWKLNEKFRLSMNGGSFSGIMPFNYGGNATPSNNSPTSYNELFLGARFNDASLAVNDVRASKTYGLADGSKLTSTYGLFMASQKLNLDWELGTFSATLPANGNSTYGAYSSIYQRNVNETFNTLAPYAALGYEIGRWNIDASVRADRQTVNGDWKDGTNATAGVAYSSSEDSYSLGANYSIDRDTALFARVSKGGAMQSDRALGSVPSLIGLNLPVNEVTQYEGGVKYRSGSFSTFVTVFQAQTKESNYDLTTNIYSNNTYDAKGVEVESAYRKGGFTLSGGFTLTDAKVTASNNAAYVGDAPNRQASAIYNLSSTYRYEAATVGASLIGTTASQDGQTTALQATLPAYSYVNAFAKYDVNKSTTVMLGVNNLFDTIGYTEINTDRAAARSITGRTVRATLRYNF